MYPPPPRMEKLTSQVNVTFRFWLMYPPPPSGMEKLKSQVNVTFQFWLMYPLPPGMEKLKSQVNVTFQFWLMSPPRNGKVEIKGQCDIFVLADVHSPHPRNRNFTKHECYRTKSFQERSSSTFYDLSPPFQYHYLILCLNRKLVNFNFKWIWIYGLEPHLPPLTSPKKMKCSFLDYIQLLMIGWAG